jgi:hypothetical protein
VKTRSLFANASFGPAELKVLYEAFDGAWEQISPGISQRAEAVEAARIKLAGTILGLASNGTRDAERLTELAIATMFGDPTKLRPK